MFRSNITSPVKSREKPFTVIVEGNIGSGKTTFLDYFQNHENEVCVLSEPVSMWQNCAGNNLLGLMYDNPNKWAFSFQSYVQLTMLQQHMKPTRLPIKLMERSVYSARYCFVENMYKEGIMPEASFCVINEWFKWLLLNVDLSIDLIVYLRTTPEIVHKRMMKRNREEEKCVPLEYLRQLHELHENWLYHKSMFTCHAPVLVVNANLDKSVITEEYQKYENYIINKKPISVNY